jgi:transcriptional regulator with XRE-family HTH domain
MVIGDRLRQLREDQNLSQGDIEKRTGLLRCCISRVENGHTVPAVETLEKFARALEVPVYQLFYEGNEAPADLPKRKSAADDEWGGRGKDARVLARFRHGTENGEIRVETVTEKSSQQLAVSNFQALQCLEGKCTL